jgi:DNA-binding NarL/FixJ family response regulator
VDDDESQRELMLRILRGDGHRVVTAPDLESAAESSEAAACDVVLLDLELPGVRGADAIVASRAIAPRARVLVVSGHDDARHVLAALEAGADGYLLKGDLGDTLPDALQAVRAGHAPLSPRVAAIALRRLRQQANSTALRLGRLPTPTKLV